MLTLHAGVNNKLILNLDVTIADPYFLLIFEKERGCISDRMILTNDSNCDDYFLFNIETDLASGVWRFLIYEQDNYENINPDLANLIYIDTIKIINNSPCLT